MTTRIKLRRDTAANWTANNPILAAGEPGLETDTGKTKYGNGTSHWADLSYATGGITAREIVGSFTGYGPSIPNTSNSDIWFDTVVADGAGNAYYVGGENDTEWLVAVKIDSEGAVVWEKEIDWADGYEGSGASAVYNTATDQLVILGHFWKNTVGNEYDDSLAVITLDASDGSLVGDPTVIRDDVITDDSEHGPLFPNDIILDSSGDPIVCGLIENGTADLYPVTTATGSTVNVAFVDAAQFADRYPLPYTNWFITGTNLVTKIYITSVNRYENQPSTTLTGTGTNATFEAHWRMKNGQIYFPDYASNFGVWINQSGSNYANGDVLNIPATSYGGTTTGTITVNSVDGNGAIVTWAFTGTFNTSTIRLATEAYYNIDYGAEGSWTVSNTGGEGFIHSSGWAKSFGTSEWDTANAMDKDSSGNIYVAVRSYDNSYSGGTTRGILLKVSSAGNLIWSKNFDPEGWDPNDAGYTGVAVDSNDDIIVTENTMVTKVDSDGTVLWQKWIAPDAPMWMYNVCVDVDSDNNVYVAAEYDWMGQTTGDDYLIVKFDSDGNLLWQREAGTNADEDTNWNDGYQILSVAGDRFYVCGSTYQGGDDIGLAMDLPTDGSGSTSTQFSRYFYKNTEWSVTTSTATVTSMSIEFNDLELTVYTTNTFAVSTLTNVVETRTIRTGDVDGRIENLYSISFEDGSVQTTAYIGGLPPGYTSPYIYNTNNYNINAADAGRMIRWVAPGWGNTVFIYVPGDNYYAFDIGTQIHFMKDQGIRALFFYPLGGNNDVVIMPSRPADGMENQVYNSGEGWSVHHPSWNEIPCIVTLTKVDVNRWLLSTDSAVQVMDWSS